MFYPLVRRGLIKPLWWQARNVRAQLLPVFTLSSWAQPATKVAVTKVEAAALASVRLVGMGSASHLGGGYDT